MKYLFLAFFSLAISACSQNELTGSQLLGKSIEYHDPNGNWSSFTGEFEMDFSGPALPDGLTRFKIDLPLETFYVQKNRDGNVLEYWIADDDCTKITLNGKSNFTEEEKKKYQLTCDRAKLWRNYYTYLYGLPMKLKDPGTLVNEKIQRKNFSGKEYLVLDVSYDNAVGSDLWYFYFDPETYAMEIYQFYKTDQSGNKIEESGEYILLSELKEINDIRIPKVRSWYYNKNDELLGTDRLR